MQACQVFSESDEIDARLEQMCLSRGALRESVNQAHLQRVRLTPNHPSIFPGLEMWGWMVGALRERLRPSGWYSHEKANYPLTVHADLGLAIAIASGDANVGVPTAAPSNKSKKGKNTVDAVQQNCQLDMFEELIPTSDFAPPIDSYDTWILLHHTDQSKREIRLELSRPSSIDSSGKINSWFERIMLGSIDIDDDSVDLILPTGPDIDFHVPRKSV